MAVDTQPRDVGAWLRSEGTRSWQCFFFLFDKDARTDSPSPMHPKLCNRCMAHIVGTKQCVGRNEAQLSRNTV